MTNPIKHFEDLVIHKEPHRFKSSDGRIFEEIDVFDPVTRTWSPFCRQCASDSEAEEQTAQPEKICPESS